MDVAVSYKKINLVDGHFLFVADKVLEGTLTEDGGVFIDEKGTPYFSVEGDILDEELYYGKSMSYEGLEDLVEDVIPKNILKSTYLYAAQQHYYKGYFDYETGNTVLEELDVATDPLNNEIGFEMDDSNNARITIAFNMDDVEVDRIHDAIDQTLGVAQKDIKGLPGRNINKDSLKKEESIHFNLAKLRKAVLQHIICQDKAVNTVTTALAANYSSKNPRHKSHILIAGPSGTGKTEMINIIGKSLDIPIFKADATSYTKEGYVGKSVQSMLTGLVTAAGGDVEKAQNGILIVDEIDKKATASGDSIAGKDVLHSLLKMMDRDVIEVSTEYYQSYMFDTSNLTIIFMGAFEDLYKKQKNNKSKSIGFNIEAPKADKKEDIKFTNQDFIDYGMTAEFMGRIGTLAFTEEFTLESLLNLLKKSKQSPIAEEREFFTDLGIKVTFAKSFLEEIARKSLQSGTGARDLKRLVRGSMVDAYDRVLTNINTKNKVKVLKFTKETVEDPKKYYVE